ncbi:MAG: hypothetical protein KDA52_15195, partial [Planctomycetaceae bacterium]|nr:hypothetical protein [Planctomycetaceae bacterium]
GPFLAEVFDFRLELKSRGVGAETQATPAFLYLPFYIDQDAGWGAPLNSLDKLAQFSDPKRDTIYFHAGLRPSEYYQARARMEDAKARAEPVRAQRSSIEPILSDIDHDLAGLDFEINLEEYQREIESLLDRYNDLHQQEVRFKGQLEELYGQKQIIDDQLTIARRTLDELRDDRQYATTLPNEIVCPTCCAVYENSFSQRLSIAIDEDSCLALIDELEDKQRSLNERAEKLRVDREETSAISSEINLLLKARREEIALADVIQREGLKDVKERLTGKVAAFDEAIGALDRVIESAREDMKVFDDKKRKQEITGYYHQEMERLLTRLNVANLSPKQYKNIYGTIKETGSDLPRALLAYYLAIVRTIWKYSTSTVCPMVVDSPRQQDQDDTNWIAMLECIRDERPEGSQLVMALVDDCGIDLGGAVIDLRDKNQLLQEGEFSSVNNELQPLIAEVLRG